MTVHLLCPADYFAVCDLLLSMNLPGWVFIVPETEIDPEDIYPGWGGGQRRAEDVQFNYYSPVEKVKYDPDRQAPLSWRKLFAVCQFYNVFIHTADWDRFLPCDPMYPVAYQMLSNALQLQVSDALGLAHKEEGMHKNSIGCMNNLCEHKGQIALIICFFFATPKVSGWLNCATTAPN